MSEIFKFVKEQKINLLALISAICFSLLFQIYIVNPPNIFIDVLFKISMLIFWWFISKLAIVKVFKVK